MKEFWKKRSYDVVKLLINQCAIAIFGLTLAIAAGMSENDTLQVITSIGAIIFYLFLIYASSFDMGLKDQPRVTSKREEFKPLNGLYVALLANVPNFILAVLISISMWFDNSVLSTIGGWSSAIAHFIQGMYTGLLTMKVGGAPLNSYWWTYFLIIIPAIAVCTLGYIFGVKGWHLTHLLIPENSTDMEKKREAKWEKKGK